MLLPAGDWKETDGGQDPRRRRRPECPATAPVHAEAGGLRRRHRVRRDRGIPDVGRRGARPDPPRRDAAEARAPPRRLLHQHLSALALPLPPPPPETAALVTPEPLPSIITQFRGLYYYTPITINKRLDDVTLGVLIERASFTSPSYF